MVLIKNRYLQDLLSSVNAFGKNPDNNQPGVSNNRISLIILFLFILFLARCNSKREEYELPTYPSAYYLESCSRHTEIRCLSYSVRMPYFSFEVIDYYNKIFKEKNWIPFIEDYYKSGDRKWIEFGDNDYWLTASWIDRKKTKRVLVLVKQMNYKEIAKTGCDIDQRITYEERSYYEIPYNPQFYLNIKE